MSGSRPANQAPQASPPTRAAERGALVTPLLALAGLFLSTFLTVMHFGLLNGDVSLGAVCGSEGDCNGVIFSRYGDLLGLPVSVWGMWYYIAAATLSSAGLFLRREDRPAFVRATLWLTVLALVFDAWLGWAMLTRVGRVCPLCIVTYAINVLILAFTLRAARDVRDVPGGMRALVPSLSAIRRPAEPAYYREVLKLYLAALGAGMSGLVLALCLVFSHLLLAAQNKELADLLRFLKSEPQHDVAVAGLPARGPERAPLSIVVFSDFLCEQCRRASHYLDVVAAGRRNSLRITYVSYPADRACNPYADKTLHPGACRVARAAACAGRQGRFWEFHDALFEDPGTIDPDKLAPYAARAGLDIAAFEACMAQGDSASGLSAGIELSHAAGVNATPTFYLNGRPIVGALKPWMLESALRALMEQPRADARSAPTP
jgi:protein-disulfide isomerase/uncharacterized membrane protein